MEKIEKNGRLFVVELDNPNAVHELPAHKIITIILFLPYLVCNVHVLYIRIVTFILLQGLQHLKKKKSITFPWFCFVLLQDG